MPRQVTLAIRTGPTDDLPGFISLRWVQFAAHHLPMNMSAVLFAAAWLLLLCCPVRTVPRQSSWLVTAEGTSSFSPDKNQFQTSEVASHSTTDGEIFVTEENTVPTATDQGGFTTLKFYEYDPGTKLQTTDKPQSENYSANSQNQVFNPECSTAKEKCSMVVNTLHVSSDIRHRYAKTVVYSKITNAGNTSNQAIFSVTLPDTAFISGFFIQIDGKVYEAYVKKRAQAEKEYQEALESGHTAAHVGTSMRDSNFFVVSVAVAARSEVAFNLTYEELLTRQLSLYHHTISVTPRQVVQNLNVDIFIHEIRNITLLSVRTSDSESKLESEVGGVLVKHRSPLSAHVRYVPNEKKWQNELGSGLQLITVEYDVDRSINTAGDIVLMDGYFVHFFAPENVPPQPKHIIFVLDTSGSMWGNKLEQLQQAMYSILENLRADDYFSLIQFSTNVVEWSGRPQDMVGLNRYSMVHEVTETNIAKAKQFIKSMEASGGTNISGAMRQALQLAAKQQCGSTFKDRTAESKDFVPQDFPQPMVMFLTDGIATAGEVLTSRILAQVRALNSEIRAPIFSLAFGDGANYRFLKRLSLQNHAFSRKIYEESDAALQLQSFYSEIASPLLTNVTFAYLDGKVDKFSLTTNQFHSYYGGSEIIVAGKVTSSNSSNKEQMDEDLGAEVHAWSGAEHKEVLYKPLFISEKSAVERRKQSHGGSLERLWAYLTIHQLLDQYLVSVDKDSESTGLFQEKQPQYEVGSPKKRALHLALKYGFVTPLTSLVVVIPLNGSEGGLSEMVKDPLGSSVLDPVQFLEATPLQNKIVPLSPIHAWLPAPTVKPIAGLTASLPAATVANYNGLRHVSNFTLADVSWLLDYLASEDHLIVTSNDGLRNNSTYLVGELPKYLEVHENAGECTTPDGEMGSCYTLASCVQAEFKDDYGTFLKYFCAIGRYAGVCCPYRILNNDISHTTGIPTVDEVTI